ncbi:PAS domain-containing protein [Alsobacter sp. R-9]
MFELACSFVVEERPLPAPELEVMRADWDRLRDEGLPSLRDIDPVRIQVQPGRVHLVAVEPGPRFRFLHYGSRVTNPDARDMTGLTTLDYDDKGFAEVVTRHYREAADLGRPVCRALRASWKGQVYDYMRLVAPFGLDDDDRVAFLLVATHRIAIPAALDRAADTATPETLRVAVERTRRLASQMSDDPAHVALEGLATAAALHFAEATAAATAS